MNVAADKTAALLQKYDIPVPRYTSYPTVPYWKHHSFNTKLWIASVKKAFHRENNELCLYIHLPFCEELCTYCACNKRITKNHKVEAPYLENVLKEWDMYLNVFDGTPIIREIHLGGGTPTFFSPENLKKLIDGILNKCKKANHHEFSVEVHPNYTTYEHLEALYSCGFNRISLGIQDFDPEVQFIINRMQSFEQTKKIADQARSLGYKSLNVDLIYGLPRQKTQSIRHTIEKIKELMPDRIAYYSYAHVPWKSKGQRRYSDHDVPGGAEKLSMYRLGSQLLENMGYERIGMDHFALPGDTLLRAYKKGSLHRNFMGYTTTSHKTVVGLGVSSISDTWDAFAQNEKTVEAWQERINQGLWPVIGGHILDEEDLEIRKHILNLMCTNETNISPNTKSATFYREVIHRLGAYEQDGLILVEGNHISVLPEGKPLIRNICSAFDRYLHHNKTEGNIFSKAI